jgi:hypothetical protein
MILYVIFLYFTPLFYYHLTFNIRWYVFHNLHLKIIIS